MEKAFKNWRAGAVHLNFPNGNHISTTWAPYSYSDNYDQRDSELVIKHGHIDPIMESDTVEIMIDCGEKLLKRLEKRFNDGYSQPFSRLPIEDWLYIVNKVASENHEKTNP